VRTKGGGRGPSSWSVFSFAAAAKGEREVNRGASVVVRGAKGGRRVRKGRPLERHTKRGRVGWRAGYRGPRGENGPGSSKGGRGLVLSASKGIIVKKKR
jgi:hypothetical protein